MEEKHLHSSFSLVEYMIASGNPITSESIGENKTMALASFHDKVQGTSRSISGGRERTKSLMKHHVLLYKDGHCIPCALQLSAA